MDVIGCEYLTACQPHPLYTNTMARTPYFSGQLIKIFEYGYAHTCYTGNFTGGPRKMRPFSKSRFCDKGQRTFTQGFVEPAKVDSYLMTLKVLASKSAFSIAFVNRTAVRVYLSTRLLNSGDDS